MLWYYGKINFLKSIIVLSKISYFLFFFFFLALLLIKRNLSDINDPRLSFDAIRNTFTE